VLFRAAKRMCVPFLQQFYVPFRQAERRGRLFAALRRPAAESETVGFYRVFIDWRRRNTRRRGRDSLRRP